MKEFISRCHFNAFFPEQLSVTAYVEHNPTFSMNTVNLNSLPNIFYLFCWLWHVSDLVLVFLLWTLNKCVYAKYGEILSGKIYFSDQTPTDDANHTEQTLLHSRKVKANTKRRKTSNTSFQEELLGLQRAQIKAQEEQKKRTNSLIASMLESQQKIGRRKRIRSRIFHGSREIILQLKLTCKLFFVCSGKYNCQENWRRKMFKKLL